MHRNGKSNLVVARALALASKTVSNRVSAIFSKLGVADRAQAIVLARDAGLGQRQFPAVEEQFPYQRGMGKTWHRGEHRAERSNARPM
jgi:hypothetical protein